MRKANRPGAPRSASQPSVYNIGPGPGRSAPYTLGRRSRVHPSARRLARPHHRSKPRGRQNHAGQKAEAREAFVMATSSLGDPMPMPPKFSSKVSQGRNWTQKVDVFGRDLISRLNPAYASMRAVRRSAPPGSNRVRSPRSLNPAHRTGRTHTKPFCSLSARHPALNRCNHPLRRSRDSIFDIRPPLRQPQPRITSNQILEFHTLQYGQQMLQLIRTPKNTTIDIGIIINT